MLRAVRRLFKASVQDTRYIADDLLSGVQRVGFALACVALVVTMLVVGVEILGRHLFGMRVPGVVEITRVVMVVCIFPALAYVQRRGSNVRAEAVLVRLSVRWRMAAEALAVVCGLAFSLIVLIGGWEFVSRSVVIRERSVGVLRLPVYPAKIVFLISVALLVLQYLADLTKLLRQYRAPGDSD